MRDSHKPAWYGTNRRIRLRETKREMLNGTEGVSGAEIIGNNTLRIRYADGRTAIRLHHTDIMTTAPEGSITLNSGGWKTVTTKDRLNSYSPYRVYSENGIWYVNGKVFYDGITFDARGNLIGEEIELKDNAARIAKIKKGISGYVALIDKADKLPFPDNGDCWYCLMFDRGGKSTDYSHLESHIEEGYLMGSILVNAMREKGYNDSQISLHYSMNLRDTFKRAVRQYLIKRLCK
jgi:hypothetical protein